MCLTIFISPAKLGKQKHRQSSFKQRLDHCKTKADITGTASQNQFCVTWKKALPQTNQQTITK